VDNVNRHLATREFHLLTRELRHFLYSCLCDVYMEAVKDVLNDPDHPQFEATLHTLFVCLTTGLKLLHPLMPFVTEELFQRINLAFSLDSGSIMAAAFPTAQEVLTFNPHAFLLSGEFQQKLFFSG
jgi:valyl-tRNA synthetase